MNCSILVCCFIVILCCFHSGQAIEHFAQISGGLREIVNPVSLLDLHKQQHTVSESIVASGNTALNNNAKLGPLSVGLGLSRSQIGASRSQHVASDGVASNSESHAEASSGSIATGINLFGVGISSSLSHSESNAHSSANGENVVASSGASSIAGGAEGAAAESSASAFSESNSGVGSLASSDSQSSSLSHGLNLGPLELTGSSSQSSAHSASSAIKNSRVARSSDSLYDFYGLQARYASKIHEPHAYQYGNILINGYQPYYEGHGEHGELLHPHGHDLELGYRDGYQQQAKLQHQSNLGSIYSHGINSYGGNSETDHIHYGYHGNQGTHGNHGLNHGTNGHGINSYGGNSETDHIHYGYHGNQGTHGNHGLNHGTYGHGINSYGGNSETDHIHYGYHGNQGTHGNHGLNHGTNGHGINSYGSNSETDHIHYGYHGNQGTHGNHGLNHGTYGHGINSYGGNSETDHIHYRYYGNQDMHGNHEINYGTYGDGSFNKQNNYGTQGHYRTANTHDGQFGSADVGSVIYIEGAQPGIESDKFYIGGSPFLVQIASNVESSGFDNNEGTGIQTQNIDAFGSGNADSNYSGSSVVNEDGGLGTQSTSGPPNVQVGDVNESNMGSGEYQNEDGSSSQIDSQVPDILTGESGSSSLDSSTSGTSAVNNNDGFESQSGSLNPQIGDANENNMGSGEYQNEDGSSSQTDSQVPDILIGDSGSSSLDSSTSGPIAANNNDGIGSQSTSGAFKLHIDDDATIDNAGSGEYQSKDGSSSQTDSQVPDILIGDSGSSSLDSSTSEPSAVNNNDGIGSQSTSGAFKLHIDDDATIDNAGSGEYQNEDGSSSQTDSQGPDILIGDSVSSSLDSSTSGPSAVNNNDGIGSQSTSGAFKLHIDDATIDNAGSGEYQNKDGSSSQTDSQVPDVLIGDSGSSSLDSSTSEPSAVNNNDGIGSQSTSGALNPQIGGATIDNAGSGEYQNEDGSSSQTDSQVPDILIGDSGSSSLDSSNSGSSTIGNDDGLGSSILDSSNFGESTSGVHETGINVSPDPPGIILYPFSCDHYYYSGSELGWIPHSSIDSHNLGGYFGSGNKFGYRSEIGNYRSGSSSKSSSEYYAFGRPIIVV